MAHLRPELAARGVLSAAALRDVPDGRHVRTAGHAIVRQRPGTAKGFCFLTLEDETGTANAVLTPRYFQRFRAALHGADLIEVAGPIQNVDGVIHVRAREITPLRRARRPAALARLSLARRIVDMTIYDDSARAMAERRRRARRLPRMDRAALRTLLFRHREALLVLL